MLDDGRSLLDTVGDKRFKVLDRGTKDGYNIAKVTFLNDDPIDDNEHPSKLLIYSFCPDW